MKPSLNYFFGLVDGGGDGVTPVALSTGLGSSDYNLPFFHYLTIPKSTTQAAYISYNLTLPIGRINRITVEFPRGCSGLAGIQLYHGVQQIFPLPAGVWLRSDNSILPFALSHDLDIEPFEIGIRGYNLDDTYEHTIWIGLEMSGQRSDLPPQLQGLIDYLTR